MVQENLFHESPPNINKYILKSATQKCVRLGLFDQGIRIAKTWLDVDPQDFLRRLPIIIFEDVILHPDLAKAVELIPKYKDLTDDDKTFLLNIVSDLISTEHRDIHIKNPDYVRHIEPAMLEYLSADEKTIIQAIDRRNKIGGMRGDMWMLVMFENIWINRFANRKMSLKDVRQFFYGEKVKYEDIEYCTKEDIPLTAIDMHCSPLVKVLVKKQELIDDIKILYPDTEPMTIISDMIWRNFSAVNHKKDISTGVVLDWYDKKYNAGDRATEKDRENIGSLCDKWQSEIESIQRWYLTKSMENEDE